MAGRRAMLSATVAAVAACGIAAVGCKGNTPSKPVTPTARIGLQPPVVTEVARLPVEDASFVDVSEHWVSWSTTAGPGSQPSRVVVYDLNTDTQTVVADVAGSGGVADYARLSGDWLVYGEQHPSADDDAGGPWQIVIKNLESGARRVLDSDEGRRALQDVRVSFTVDDTRVLWIRPALEKSSTGAALYDLMAQDLTGGPTTRVATGDFSNSVLSGGHVVVQRESSPTTVDAFIVDSPTDQRQLTFTGNVNRVTAGTADFVLVEVNRDGRLNLVAVPYDAAAQPTDIGGEGDASNGAVGDDFIVWWTFNGTHNVIARLDAPSVESSVHLRGRTFVPGRTAASGTLAAWAEARDDRTVEVVVVRVTVPKP